MTGTLVTVPVDLGTGVRAAFTMGQPVPGGPVHNLSVTVGDPTDAPARRAELEAWVGAPVAYARQVHGRAVHVCDGPPGDPAGDRAGRVPVAEADALVTRGPATAVAVLVADCVPVLLADATAGVVAAVHAGRRGVVAGVVPAAAAAMARLGAVPERVRAVVGPAICGRCYEVPAALRDEVGGDLPAAVSTTWWGTPALDLPGAVRGQLVEAGVASIDMLGVCTLEDRRWFSHRGGGPSRPAGRFAAVVRALPPGRMCR